MKIREWGGKAGKTKLTSKSCDLACYAVILETYAFAVCIVSLDASINDRLQRITGLLNFCLDTNTKYILNAAGQQNLMVRHYSRRHRRRAATSEHATWRATSDPSGTGSSCFA